MEAFEVEQLLFDCPECNVFKLPPVKSAGGYKASTWQDNLIWTGACRIVSKGDCATVKLLEGNGEVYAQCPIKTGPNAPKCIEPVIDSSRYFVLRIEDQGRHAFIGIGFQDRDEAFDFKVVLTDHKRAEQKFTKPVYTGPKQELGLKEGQKIVVSLGGKKGQDKKKAGGMAGSSGGFALAPPPSGPSTRPGVAPPPVAVPAPSPPPPSVPPVQPVDAGLFGTSSLQQPQTKQQPQQWQQQQQQQWQPQQQQPQQQQSSPLFGSPATASQPSSSSPVADLFGTPAAPPPQQSPDLFGGASQQQSMDLFGPPGQQQPQRQQPSLFGQPQPQQQQQQQGSDMLIFGPAPEERHKAATASILSAFDEVQNPQPLPVPQPPVQQMAQFDPFA